MATVQTDYPNALPVGTMLMEYRLDAVLGVGGFGITYLARDTLLDKAVAIKEYFPGGAVSRRGDGEVTLTTPDGSSEYETGLERFLKEARTLAGFSHPNIVRVNRYFKSLGTGYMVMDYEEGEPLRAWLKRSGSPSEAALRDLVGPLLEGIEKVHAAGFLHRDIKPDNIIVRKGGTPVMIDFGSARQAMSATQALTAMVTPGYAPFEQYSSDSPQGPYTDVYALGGVLFFAVVGRSPPDAIARMHSDTLLPILDSARARYSPSFIDAIAWAMAIKPDERPKTLKEWREKLLSGTPMAPGAASEPTVMPGPVTVTGPAPTKPPSTAPYNEVPIDTAAATNDQDIAMLLAKRDQLERAVKEKFQRVLTVMFTDLKGSTSIAESSGDIAVRGMLQVYHDLCTRSIEANGGHLVKTIGDGSLSHFPDALAACRAAAAIQRGMEQINISKKYSSLLLARIGMHTGECLVEKNDIFGDVVNTASRFESSAHPGEILISEETYNALSSKDEFYSRFDREVALKGKSHTFRAYIVFWDPKEIERDRSRPAPSAKPPTPLWKIAAFITVPLLIVLVATFYVTSGNKLVGEEKRSINYSVPGK